MPFVDDPNIGDDVLLVRVLRHHSWAHPPDAPTRPSSVAFLDSNGENSCFIAAEADFFALAERFPGVRYGAITAGNARTAGFCVWRDEEGADGLPGHVIVGFAVTDTNMPAYRKAAKRLAAAGTVYAPENPRNT